MELLYENIKRLKADVKDKKLFCRLNFVDQVCLTFESSFFPYSAKEWGNLSEELRNIGSIKTFKLSILNFVRPRENSVFAVHDINDLKLLSCLRLNFSHLNEHKFLHNFNDTINPMCSFGKEPETTLHYLLRCDFYSMYRLELLNDICALNHSLNNILEEDLLKVLLYGAEEKNFLSRLILKF